MNTLLLAIVAVIAVYLLIVVILPRSLRGESTAYTQRALDRIFKESSEQTSRRVAEASTLLRDTYAPASGLGRAFLSIPGMQSMRGLMLKAGLEDKSHVLVLSLIGLWVLLSFIGYRIGLGALGVLAAAAASLLLGQMYLKRRVKKRNEQFINMFPDALDMIVRSVRSGFPLNTALRMIAENMDPPVGTEFKQVVDEIAFGRSMSEALQRLSQRIDEADIQFFVVVLNVQQEAGGNLAEILSNLANIIRKRKQLRLKIKALTSEGRATGWVLGLLPVFVFVVLMFASPTHLEPLFDTEPGRILLGLAISMVLLAGWIVRQMIQIDI